jgi:hypothetical protein
MTTRRDCEDTSPVSRETQQAMVKRAREACAGFKYLDTKVDDDAIVTGDGDGGFMVQAWTETWIYINPTKPT